MFVPNFVKIYCPVQKFKYGDMHRQHVGFVSLLLSCYEGTMGQEKKICEKG